MSTNSTFTVTRASGIVPTAVHANDMEAATRGRDFTSLGEPPAWPEPGIIGAHTVGRPAPSGVRHIGRSSFLAAAADLRTSRIQAKAWPAHASKRGVARALVAALTKKVRVDFSVAALTKNAGRKSAAVPMAANAKNRPDEAQHGKKPEQPRAFASEHPAGTPLLDALRSTARPSPPGH